MKCDWPTITLASAGFAISTILSCIVLAPCDYCADDTFVDAAPEVSIRQWRRGGYRPDLSHEFRDAAAVVFLSALFARAAHIPQERLGRALRFCRQFSVAQLARRPHARARDGEPCGDHDLRARVDRRDLPGADDSAGQRRGARRAPSQHSRRAARAVLSL